VFARLSAAVTTNPHLKGGNDILVVAMTISGYARQDFAGSTPAAPDCIPPLIPLQSCYRHICMSKNSATPIANERSLPPMCPRTKEQNEAIRQQRTEQILTAAAETYFRTGGGFDIRDVAKQAGLGYGTVYHYYANRHL